MTNQSEANDRLLQQAAQGDPQAQSILIQQNTGLVHSIVRRFLGRGQEREDLFQVGCIGLIKAVQKFDLSYQVKFSTYAVPMIMGEIKRFIRDDGPIKVSRSLKETAAKALALKNQLTVTTGTEPTLGELAAKLDLSPAELAIALDSGIRPESLYAVSDDGSRENLPLIERLENETNYETEIVDKLTLRQLLSELPHREQLILTRRYFKQETQSQIAAQLGISQVQVSRIEKKLLLQLRERMTADG